MNNPSGSGTANGESTLHDLFTLSDEQILNIEPETTDATAESLQAAARAVIPSEGRSDRPEPRDPGKAVTHTRFAETSEPPGQDSSASSRSATGTSVGMTDAAAAPPNGAGEAPPKWLAERMNDPWNGEEASQFWQGIQREREDAAAYRGVFAKPEDARAASERSRQLEQIDQLYFGAAGKSPEESAAAREQLVQLLLREDPAAFREMVFAGLRALENAGPAHTGSPQPVIPSEARNLSSSAANSQRDSSSKAPRNDSGRAEAELAAYAAFEKAANEDLEREVGGTIARVLEQALPVAQPLLAVRSDRATGGAQARVPALHDRLAAAVRQDVEAALKNDRQLGEQVALVITGRRPGEAGPQRQAGAGAPRFDEATRAQVVRLIGERARQLVPSAAKRVLQEWTQTALAAHRARTQKSEAAASRRDVEGVSGVPESARAKAQAPRQVDYRKLSDQQILDM